MPLLYWLCRCRARSPLSRVLWQCELPHRHPGNHVAALGTLQAMQWSDD